MPLSSYPAKTDPLTSSGLAHSYDLDYSRAIRDFERVLEKYPDDPFALNHLAETIFFSELHRAGVLDTGLYSSNAFLSKRRITITPDAQKRILDLSKRSIELCERRIDANEKDADAFYARGVARGLRASYTALIDRAWFTALKSAKGARKDHERVLELNPNYSDAKLVVGMHDYIVGSLPWGVRMLARIVGEGGDKQDGLKYMKEASEGRGEVAVDATVMLGVFLRREKRYEEALALGRALRQEHPHNFLFAMEEGNVLKDWGKGPEAIEAYRRILAGAKEGKYFAPHVEFAYWGLGEALRGQHDYEHAAESYDAVQALPNADSEIVLRATLAAGQMYDLLNQREQAMKKYQAVLAAKADSEQASLARRLMKQPYGHN